MIFEDKKLIIFDFDGTLFDTMHAWTGFGEKCVRHFGGEPEEGLTEKLNAMPSLVEAAKYINANYCDVPFEKILEYVTADISDFYIYKAMPKAGAENFVKAVYERGIKLCILTANDGDLIYEPLKRCGLDKYFDGIFITNKIGVGKDRPEAFEYVMNRYGVQKEETLFIDDALYAVKTAKAMGLTVAAIAEATEPDEAGVKQNCDIFISTFNELL